MCNTLVLQASMSGCQISWCSGANQWNSSQLKKYTKNVKIKVCSLVNYQTFGF